MDSVTEIKAKRKPSPPSPAAEHTLVGEVAGKVCRGKVSCHQWHPLDDYNSNAQYEDGYSGQCKACKQKARHIREVQPPCPSEPHTFVDGVEGKACRGKMSCGKWIPLEMYTRNSDYTDGLAHQCQDCKKRARDERADGYVSPDETTPLALTPSNAALFLDPETERCNLTAMWQASEESETRSPRRWVQTEGAIQFIAALETDIKTVSLEALEGRAGGTWAHWQIGVEYARYLSPAFAIRWNNYARAYLDQRRHATMSMPELPPVPVAVTDPYEPLLDVFSSTGTQSQLLTRHFQNMDRFCQEIPAVYEALERHRQLLAPLVEAVKKRRNPKTHGWMYVFKDTARRSPRYKIGLTQRPDPAERQREVEGQWGKGQSDQVIWIESDDAVKLEKHTQRYYKTRNKFTHLGEEWFALSESDLICLAAIGPFVRYADFHDELLMSEVITQESIV